MQHTFRHSRHSSVLASVVSAVRMICYFQFFEIFCGCILISHAFKALFWFWFKITFLWWFGFWLQITQHHVSKNTCQLMFRSVSVKYESISIKIGRHVLEETLNKIMQKLPISLKICASTTSENLKWQIEQSMQYLHVHFNKSLNSHKHDW